MTQTNKSGTQKNRKTTSGHCRMYTQPRPRAPDGGIRQRQAVPVQIHHPMRGFHSPFSEDGSCCGDEVRSLPSSSIFATSGGWGLSGSLLPVPDSTFSVGYLVKEVGQVISPLPSSHQNRPTQTNRIRGIRRGQLPASTFPSPQVDA